MRRMERGPLMKTFSDWCKANDYDEPQLTPRQLKHLNAAWRQEEGEAEGEPPSADAADVADEIRAIAEDYVSKHARSEQKTAALRALGEQLISSGATVKEAKL